MKLTEPKSISEASNTIEYWYLISFVILGLFPIAPFKVKPFLIGPLVMISLLHVFKTKKIEWQKVVVSTALFLVFSIGILYSSDFSRAIKLSGRLVPFLILPITYSLIPDKIYKTGTTLFLKVFIYSCTLFCILIFAYAISLNSTDLPYIYSYLSNKFWGYSDHPIYSSLYIGIALIALAHLKNLPLKILLFLIMVFTLLFLSRKGNILGLIVVLFIAMISNYKIIRKKGVLTYVVSGLLILCLVSLVFNNYLWTRFEEVLEVENILNNTESSTGIRSILWTTSFSLINESPLIGYGLGDVQTQINNRLIEGGYEELTTIHIYNAHNQYLQIALCSGYLGLLCFVGILRYIFRQIRHRAQFVYIFLYIVICFLFESILERQNGIFISAVFLNLFLFYPKKNGS